nr:hypothetical protein [Tanacetum cinerariifolium]
RLRNEQDESQKALDQNPHSIQAHEKECLCLIVFNEAVLDEESLLQQKEKIKWLRVGDSNTGYFHKVVKGRINKIRIQVVRDASNVEYEGQFVKTAFVNHYQSFLELPIKRGPPRCAFKVDIQKAYDTVDWGSLPNILIGFGFHEMMISWIMVCVSSTTFSLNINGELCGFFQGKRGLRQGDPMSPYLFTLVMEVLTLMLKQKDVLGLVPSVPKSTAFFSNVPYSVKQVILKVTPFKEGDLHVKYLGVSLISSRLLCKDCKFLVEKVQNQIGDWKNKLLSFTGRVQLIISVLSSMHVYWSSVFILPVAIWNDMEKLIRGFLLCQGEMKRRKAKVLWDEVCLPKCEGGLGIMSLHHWNMALMATHIYNVLLNKESL